MRRLTFSVLVGGALVFGAAGCHKEAKRDPERFARGKGPQKLPPKPPAKDDDDLKPFEKLTAGAKAHKGLFELYQKGDKLYLVVPKNRLGKEFLLHARIARGIGMAPLLTGYTLKTDPVYLAQHGDRVFLMQKQVRLTAHGELQRAVARAYGDSVLDSAKIESKRKDGAVVVDIQKWLLGDLAELAPRVKAAIPLGDKPSYSADRSFIESVKALPDNVNVRATLTFSSAAGTPFYTVADDRFVPLTVLYQLLKLPEQPMAPRLADDRVGYFVTAVRDFSSQDPDLFARYVRRWRLESAGVDDGLHVPRKPIVYYLDPATPREIRPYLIEAVAAWQRAFTAAGWKDAIRAEVLPDGVDPEDLRYPLIHWDASDNAPTGIGMPITDPRSGEILGASITLNVSDFLRAGHRTRRMFYGDRGGTAFDEPAPSQAALGQAGLEAPELRLELFAQQSLLRTAMLASGALLPNDPMPQRVLMQFVRMVTMHEVGHTLGLRHNFKASTETPVEKLSDMAWVREHGIAGSVMEYPGLNLPRGTAPPDFLYYQDRVGPADLWTIGFGYHPDEVRARDLARRAAAPGHAFATDEDAATNLDPTVRTWDLGGEPLAWARERTAIIRALFDELPRRLLLDNTAYYEMTDTLEDLIDQYMRAAAVLPSYVGGRYTARDHVGDPGGRLPLLPVPKAKQREALQLLDELMFSERALALSPEVLTRLAGSRWQHWGMTGATGPDSPVLLRLGAARRSALASLLSERRIGRMYEGEQRFGKDAVLTLPELLDALSKSLLSELAGPLRPVSAPRRELQRSYVEALCRFVLESGSPLAADLRALSRLHLLDLKQKLDGKPREIQAAEPYTRAHLAEMQAHVTKVLAAQVTESAGGGGGGITLRIGAEPPVRARED